MNFYHLENLYNVNLLWIYCTSLEVEEHSVLKNNIINIYF